MKGEIGNWKVEIGERLKEKLEIGKNSAKA